MPPIRATVEARSKIRFLAVSMGGGSIVSHLFNPRLTAFQPPLEIAKSRFKKTESSLVSPDHLIFYIRRNIRA